jgi:hypothetical protein
MKRLLAVVGGALLVASLPYAAGAQETKWVQGTVSAMAGNTITVKVRDKEMTFNVDDKTQMTARGASTATRTARAEGKPGPTLAEIVKVGQGVEVRYHESGMHAASIRVLSTTPAGSTSEDSPKTLSATGTVSAVTGSSLTVKGRGGEWTFVIDPKTQVTGEGMGTKAREKKAAGEKPVITDFVGNGDTVTVRYTEADGTKHAQEVRVSRKAGTQG